jgi:hypothetical protein
LSGKKGKNFPVQEMGEKSKKALFYFENKTNYKYHSGHYPAEFL